MEKYVLWWRYWGGALLWWWVSSGLAGDVMKAPPLSYPALDEALQYNLKGNDSFLSSFRDPTHWIVRRDSDVEWPVFDAVLNAERLVILTEDLLPPVRLRVPEFPTITASNKKFADGMSRGKPKAISWASQRNGMARSWILPPYHPRQHRQQCLQAAISSSREPMRFYTPSPVQRPEYTLYLKNAVINVNGIVGTYDGYIHYREGCENQVKLGLEWHSQLISSFKRIYSNIGTQLHELIWNRAFENEKIHFSGYSARSKKQMPKSIVEDGSVLGAVFVLDAIWDYNFHHALLDSISKLVHWHPFLLAHPDIYIHIRCYELYTRVSRADRFKYLKFRHTLFSFLGIDMQRVIYGEVAAKVVYAPRQLGCIVYTKHKKTLHEMTKLLALRSYGPQVSMVDYYRCGVSPLQSKQRKKAIIQVRPCPEVIINRVEGRANFWRCLNDTESTQLKGAMTRTLSDNWAIQTSDQFSSTDFDDSVRAFSCDIQEYLDADMIVGVHGAGLTHMMFLKPGSIVVELIGQWDGRMTPLCGFHGPLASVYDIHHYIHYYDAFAGQTVDFVTLAEEIRNFASFAEKVNNDKKQFSELSTKYYDKAERMFDY